ncbi:MAG: hypothetical protein JWR58_4757, partial [Pseudonocardia sp.]|nr:hypothetical protein [Pseudonocardia sp.]
AVVPPSRITVLPGATSPAAVAATRALLPGATCSRPAWSAIAGETGNAPP